jgi:hypothetical protein
VHQKRRLTLNATALVLGVAMIACSVLSPSVAEASGNARLRVDVGGTSGSECLPDRGDVLLAGSQGEIVLQVYGEKSDKIEYRGLPSGPPGGLVMTAWLKVGTSDDTVGSAALIKKLGPQFYVTFNQIIADSGYQQVHKISEQAKRPQYHFLITLPSDCAGRKLCVKAAIDDSQFGRIEGTGCTEIVAPCSKRDRDQVKSSYIKFAFDSQNYDRAIQLTDSLLQTDWRFLWGLMEAGMAARASGRFDRAIAYLDSSYSYFGSPEVGYPLHSPQAEQEYQRQRADLIRLRDQRH